jgi:hypothetical protein
LPIAGMLNMRTRGVIPSSPPEPAAEEQRPSEEATARTTSTSSIFAPPRLLAAPPPLLAAYNSERESRERKQDAPPPPSLGARGFAGAPSSGNDAREGVVRSLRAGGGLGSPVSPEVGDARLVGCVDAGKTIKTSQHREEPLSNFN